MPESKGTVLYVGGFELPDRNAAAHRVLNNAKILRELGYNVVFCGIDKEIKVIPEETTRISGFESTPMPYPASSKQWIKQMLDISIYMDMFSKYRDIKLIICYNLHAVPLAKLLKQAKKRNVKVIADSTEWYGNKLSLNPVKLIKCIDTFLCMRHFQKKCNGMITISSYLERYYKKYIKNIMVLPPLVDLEEEKYQNTISQQNNVTTLVYSGSPSTSKEALGDVVKCLSNLTQFNFKLNVVGITESQFLKMYNVMPNCDKIAFIGKVSHAEALNAVKQSDYSLIIRPRSRVNMAGFPTKFTEAISCGTAVIANNISDVFKYIEDGNNGFKVSLNSLQKDLQTVLASKEKPAVKRDIFDYRLWIEPFSEFLKELDL